MSNDWNDEWRSAVNAMTEMDRAVATEDRHAHLGVVGGPEDDQ